MFVDVTIQKPDYDRFLQNCDILRIEIYQNSEKSPFPSVRENGTGYLLTSKRIQDYMGLYVQSEEDSNSPYFAPLLATDLSKQPDTLIITAEYDPLRDEGEEYGKRLKEYGNYVEAYYIKDVLHGFFLCRGYRNTLKNAMI